MVVGVLVVVGVFGGSGGEGILCAVWEGLVPGRKGKGLGLVIFDLVSIP